MWAPGSDGCGSVIPEHAGRPFRLMWATLLVADSEGCRFIVCFLCRARHKRHTFGRRLRAAGVSFEDRQDLLGHRSGRMTTHYSAAELTKLIEAANRVCERKGNKPELVVLRRLSVS